MRRVLGLPTWQLLVVLVGVSAAFRAAFAETIPTPWIAPDELIYAELGRSLWTTGRLDLLGEPTRFFSLVTPVLVGLPLRLDDVGLGYALLKALQSVVMSLAAVPVYLWGRTITTRGYALLAAALTVAVPGLAYAGLVMTEVALYPLLVLAAWAIARTLVRPTLAAQALALGAVMLVTATRLQGAVLVAAWLTAAVVHALLERRPRLVLRQWPAAAGIVVLAAAWTVWQLRNGGPASQVLGAYQAAGEVDYGVGDALRFVVYHAADVVVFTGLFPVCATALLFVAGGRTTGERAFLAVAASVTAWEVGLVGVFASRHVGHLAERNLFAIAPLLFLGFAVWLERGGPRPRLATAIVASAAVALVLALPVERFVSVATIPDAFTLIPLWRLGVHRPGLSLELVLDLVAAAAALAFALVPRRRLAVLPAVLLLALAVASVSASRVVAAQATLTQPGTVGPVKTWVDRAARGRAAYLYTGDVFWNSVWETAFWNRRVRKVYDLLEAEVPGGLPQTSLGPYEDGTLVDKFGHAVRVPYVVSSDSLRLAGRRVSDGRNSIVLWRAAQPLRLRQWIQNVRFDGTVDSHARVVVYACRGGILFLDLKALEPTTVDLRRNEKPYEGRDLHPGEHWVLGIPAEPRRPLGRRLCSFDVLTKEPLQATLVRFDRRAD
jgi:hypothetical protein